jgi:hypothetical protein
MKLKGIEAFFLPNRQLEKQISGPFSQPQNMPLA